jgi:hypothetical protein
MRQLADDLFVTIPAYPFVSPAGYADLLRAAATRYRATPLLFRAIAAMGFLEMEDEGVSGEPSYRTCREQRKTQTDEIGAFLTRRLSCHPSYVHELDRYAKALQELIRTNVPSLSQWRDRILSQSSPTGYRGVCSRRADFLSVLNDDPNLSPVTWLRNSKILNARDVDAKGRLAIVNQACLDTMAELSLTDYYRSVVYGILSDVEPRMITLRRRVAWARYGRTKARESLEEAERMVRCSNLFVEAMPDVSYARILDAADRMAETARTIV